MPAINGNGRGSRLDREVSADAEVHAANTRAFLPLTVKLHRCISASMFVAYDVQAAHS